MHIIIAGCGRVGAGLATELSCEGHDIVIIDNKPDSFERLGSSFNGITCEGMAFDEETLLKAGIENADVFAATTNTDNTNLMACEIVSNVYHVSNVLSRLYNPHKELTFFILNIAYICGTTLITDRIREKLFQTQDLIVQHERSDVKMQVIEFMISKEAAGKQAGALDFGVSSKLIALLRNNREIQWNDNTLLREGDRVIVNMRREGWKAVTDCLGADIQSPTCKLNITPTNPKNNLAVIKGAPANARVLIAGCSEVGSYLAYMLSLEGHNVTVIDSNPMLFERLPKNYTGTVTQGNVQDESTLIKAGINEADAFIAATKSDDKNLTASEIARNIFGVPYVVAKLFNPDNEPAYRSRNLNYVSGRAILTRAMLEQIQKPRVRITNSVFNNLYNIIEFNCPEAWEGKQTGRAMEMTSIKFAYITRRSTGYFPHDNFILKSGDTVTALANEKQSRKLEEYLRKD